LDVTNFLLYTVLCLPRLSPKSTLSKLSIIIGLLKLNTAFFVSALVHFAGEYMMLGRGGTGAFCFFILQPWIITLEIAVRYLITVDTPTNEKLPPLKWRLLGYFWVISWFFAVAPFIQQPMIEAGVFVGPSDSRLTQSVGRWLAIDVI
jgi:hypothetical protein